MIRHIVRWDIAGKTVDERQGNVERVRDQLVGVRTARHQVDYEALGG